MIEFIAGSAEKETDGLVVLDQNIAYRIHSTDAVEQEMKDSSGDYKIYIVYTVNGQTYVPKLFGFIDPAERSMFNILITVQRVGHNTALSVLNAINHHDLAILIVQGDEAALTKVKGIGKQTAKRIIVDLQDKLKKLVGGELSKKSNVASPGILGDALKAIKELGYSGDKKIKEVLSTLSQDSEMSSVAHLVIGYLKVARNS